MKSFHACQCCNNLQQALNESGNYLLYLQWNKLKNG
jgi:hypothetical protein